MNQIKMNADMIDTIVKRWTDRTATLSDEGPHLPVDALLGEAMDVAEFIETNFHEQSSKGIVKPGRAAYVKDEGFTAETSTELRELQLPDAHLEAVLQRLLARVDPQRGVQHAAGRLEVERVHLERAILELRVRLQGAQRQLGRLDPCGFQRDVRIHGPQLFELEGLVGQHCGLRLLLFCFGALRLGSRLTFLRRLRRAHEACEIVEVEALRYERRGQLRALSPDIDRSVTGQIAVADLALELAIIPHVAFAPQGIVWTGSLNRTPRSDSAA